MAINWQLSSAAGFTMLGRWPVYNPFLVNKQFARAEMVRTWIGFIEEAGQAVRKLGKEESRQFTDMFVGGEWYRPVRWKHQPQVIHCPASVMPPKEFWNGYMGASD